jgi:AcrR family transcriptional regulator
MAVGVRDIARDLGLSPGNVSYHFPTKEDLVTTLVENAHRENNAAVPGQGRELDFARTQELLRGIMRRDLENPWLMRDYVSLLFAFPSLRSLNVKLHEARTARINHVVAGLIAARLLDRKRTERALPTLRLQIFTQVFFWLPAATLAAIDRNPASSLDAHARAVMALFLPYCTTTGRRQLEADGIYR